MEEKGTIVFRVSPQSEMGDNLNLTDIEEEEDEDEDEDETRTV